MTAVTIKQNERLVKALEGISLGLNLLARIEQAKFDKQYPPEAETHEAEIFRTGQGKEIPEVPAGPGRFEKLLKRAKEEADTV